MKIFQYNQNIFENEWDKIIKGRKYSDKKLIKGIEQDDVDVNPILIKNDLGIVKFTKVFSNIVNYATSLSSKKYNSFVTLLHKKIGSTKFFDKFIPSMYLLNVESIQQMIKDGLVIKYGVHLTEILESFFSSSTVTTTHENVLIDGIWYRKETILTPLYQMDYKVLDLILSTNKEIVSNKHLMYANTINNLDLFRILLKHFNGTIRSLNKYSAEFKEYINSIS